MKWLIGIDEAGRGPLAGPVAVGVAAIPLDFDWALIPGVGDSKQIKEKERERVFARAKELKKLGQINFAVCQVSASLIDKKGIVNAVSTGMKRALDKLALDPNDCVVRLDGSLRAPAVYLYQTTIIGGDGIEPSIGLASIMAKVTRDRWMMRLARQPHLAIYNFDVHKGYGTVQHRALIKQYGLSAIHRRSFCRNIQAPKLVV